jgi:hypothetical protein
VAGRVTTADARVKLKSHPSIKGPVDYSLEGGSTEGGSITFQPGQTRQTITIHTAS